MGQSWRVLFSFMKQRWLSAGPSAASYLGTDERLPRNNEDWRRAGSYCAQSLHASSTELNTTSLLLYIRKTYSL